jgi:hypothetical protein
LYCLDEQTIYLISELSIIPSLTILRPVSTMLSFLAGTSLAVLLFSPHVLAQDVATTQAYRLSGNQDSRSHGNQDSRPYENRNSKRNGNQGPVSVILWEPFWNLKTAMRTLATYTRRQTFANDLCTSLPGVNLILII